MMMKTWMNQTIPLAQVICVTKTCLSQTGSHIRLKWETNLLHFSAKSHIVNI